MNEHRHLCPLLLLLSSALSVSTESSSADELVEAAGVKAGLLINATRVAIVGQAVAPPLFDTMVAIGKQRVVARLRRAVSFHTQ